MSQAPEPDAGSPARVLRVTFSASEYSADALQRATYRLAHSLSGDVRRVNDDLVCNLYVDSSCETPSADLEADFRKAAVDEVLRARIREETRDVRNIILALAFSNTGLVDSE
jgi:His-Xaa-Ser system protein HxsD